MIPSVLSHSYQIIDDCERATFPIDYYLQPPVDAKAIDFSCSPTRELPGSQLLADHVERILLNECLF